MKPQPNHLLINLGDILAHQTNYKLKATKHRVLDIGVKRYSQPFFLEPKYSASIPANLLVGDDE